ncbi:CRISPR-associated protein Cas1 [Rhodomicrobium vannielii ATCC 17100]|uniref:CRISPR-associated endonuclease Cas1 n=1 Tax=Rhodomicrobium vannielii (strain ATCC 17100 / DSM 162 / LMG 4299 / NCIMB 10020 / ATH 3.1.1) TaxID=648757 RepID=E3I079_RHOVT|nr:CRISPR-associated endonuclease Cas1 [Rhodomicrobium vannielii]ADP71114.1 CRISPR-associated protein Cas1 [Rhodomicrobium vannielii ATCC 17100]
MLSWGSFQRLFGSAPPPSDWPPPLSLEEEAEQDIRFSPAAAPVHVLSGAAVVRVNNSTLLVERPGEPVFERPIELVSTLHIHGWARVTGACIGRLTAQGATVVWRGLHGYPVALAQPMHGAGLDIRRAQYFEAAGERGLAIARALISAKIQNMRGLVRRRANIEGRDCLTALAALAKKAKHASRESLLGIEGSATAFYFSAWPHMFAARAGDVEFEVRSRRPPQNAVNATLSYAYAVLSAECVCALAAVGLDPRLGVFHQPRSGRASLALDLMEPFRPLIADQAVLTGFNTGQIRTGDAAEADDGWRLGETGKRTVIDLMEKRLTTAISVSGTEQQVSYREAIGRQARGIATALQTGAGFEALERP